MKKNVLLMIALIVIGCGGPPPVVPAVPGRASGEEIKLSLVREVILQDDQTISAPVEVSSFQYSDGLMYIADTYKLQQAYVYDEGGRLITLVGGPGQGPGEYSRPGGFCRSGEKLHVATGTKYILYDLDGKHLKTSLEVTTGGIPRTLQPGPNGTVFYTTYSRHAPDATVYKISDDAKLLKPFSPTDSDFNLFWDMVHPMGLVVVNKDYISQIFIHKYEIKYFDLNGNYIKTIPLASSIYNAPSFKKAKNLSDNKKEWWKFATEYTLVKNFFEIGQNYVTNLAYTNLSQDRDIMEFWANDFMGMGRCFVPENELLVGSHEDQLVFYNGDTHTLYFRKIVID